MAIETIPHDPTNKPRNKGTIVVEKGEFPVSEEYQASSDLNFRPIAYAIFALTLIFILFITYLISQHT